MKEEIAVLLRHPCKVIIGAIKRADCQYSMTYDASNPACTGCELANECSWLCNFDNVRATAGLSAAELLKSLHAGRELVLTCIDESHNPSACACENCRWLRQSRRLLLQAGEKPR